MKATPLAERGRVWVMWHSFLLMHFSRSTNYKLMSASYYLTTLFDMEGTSEKRGGTFDNSQGQRSTKNCQLYTVLAVKL